MKRIICLVTALCIMISLCGCNYDNIKEFVQRKFAENLNLYSLTNVPNGESIGTIDGEPLIKGIVSGSDERLEDLYYYGKINDDAKKIYRVLLWIAESFTENWVDVTGVNDVKHNLLIAYRALINDFPEYFWIPSSYKISRDNIHNAVSFYETGECETDAETAEQMLEEFKSITDTILSPVQNMTDIFQKELYLHDAVCKMTTYNEDAKYCYSAYGALVEGEAVCEGYARAFYYLCKKAGINCLFVNGDSEGEGHLWNMVEMPDGWYHTDCTWDDTETEPSHGYFNISEEQIKKDHTFKPLYSELYSDDINSGETFNFEIISTTGTDYNYFNRYGTVIDSTDISATANEVIRRYKLGYSTAQLCFENEEELDKFNRNYEEFVVDVQKIISKELNNAIKLKSFAYQLNTVILVWRSQ